MLLTIAEIKSGLRSKLSPATLRLMTLEGPGVSEDVLNVAEKQIHTILPAAFRGYMKLFDFSRLRMHGLIFQYGVDLTRFIATNVGEPFPWWKGDKPIRSIWVGHTDGHLLVMDEPTGIIRAFDKATAQNKGVIASTFQSLLVGAGTLAARETGANNIEIAMEVASDVGADSDTFWRQLAARSA